MSYKHTYSTYALKDGNLISINDVEKGLKCHCFCPACGEELIARKGNIKIHHFAHKNKLNCEYGYESTLHLMAKDILSKAKMITLPEVFLHFNSCKASLQISNTTEVSIDNVELEKRIGNIIPDIVVYSNNRVLLIEIYVTHKIDEIKLDKIKKLNLSTIEIDLSQKNDLISYEELEFILLNGINNKSWIYNALEQNIKNQFLENAETLSSTNITCPLQNKLLEDVFAECCFCPYYIDDSGQNIKCTGKTKIATLQDLKLKEEERKDRTKCLICGKKLIPQKFITQNSTVSGLCCENFPECRYITYYMSHPCLFYDY